ncbi:MAG: hypothetical protein CMH83_04580 [Nocardioides sp.]|nr:hypothetical protein [Nocardioides sp.]
MPSTSPWLAVNQATTETSTTRALVAGCVAAGIDGVSLWRHQYVDGSAATTRQVLDDQGVRATALCRGGFFTGTRPNAETVADNEAAVAEAAALGAPVLVLVCGPVVGTHRSAADEARARIRDGVARLLPVARTYGVRLAVEPFHPMFLAERSAIVTLDQALDLVEELDDDHLGVAVDTYHVWWDAGLDRALNRAAGHVLGLHVADWLVPTPDLLAGRGLPGDGCIDVAGIVAAVRAGGYTGPAEVEVLNPDVWARDLADLLPDLRDRMAALDPVAVPA